MRFSFTKKDIAKTAEKILSMDPEPIPKYVLLKEVLEADPHDSELKKSYTEVKETRWYKQLEENQLPNGSWGAFPQ